MNADILFQTSIIAAFLAGMIALFAPCCVSYLLPAYLGSVFKERKRVLFMTLVYSLGIFVVMIPAVLGSKLISLAVFRYHEQIYLLGGFFMLIVGVTSLFGLKLPMPNIKQSGKQGTDVASIFMLGVFSGITSACCAPVLVGVLTLSFLSPSLWQALLIGFVYVLGMVTPLYIGSYFLDSKKVLGMTFFKRKLGEVKIFSKTYPIIMGNVLSFLIFTLTGLLVVYLTLATDFSVAEMAQGFSGHINKATLWLNSIPGANYIFLVVIALFFFTIVKHALSSRGSQDTENVAAPKEDCCENEEGTEHHEESCCGGDNKDESGGCCGVENDKIIKPLQYFVFGVVFLLSLYLLLMRITTGSLDVAISQFNFYQPWILTLSVGFGIQLALYKLIKIKHVETMGTEKMAKVTSATNTATMVACCAHHAIDLLPIVGASALASFLGAYTKELFAVGIAFNLFGIGYMFKQLKGLSYGKI